MIDTTAAAARTGTSPANGLPQMTITLLGVSASGKSTYILGAYHTLNRGEKQCFLHTSHDEHTRLQAAWDQLDATGSPPPPNNDEPVRHQFTFTRANRPLVQIDLTDYRGGTLYSFVGADASSDTAEVLRRLAVSHAVFVVFDSAHFTEPVTGARENAVARAVGAGPISNLLNQTFETRRARREPLPHVVILLTKADLLDGRLGGVSRSGDELYGEVRNLLRVAFQPDVDTRFYPVTLGALHDGSGQRVSAGRIAPLALHLPLIYAVSGFLRDWAEQIRVQLVYAKQEFNQTCRWRDQVRSSGGLRWRRRRKRLVAAEAAVQRQLAVARQMDEQRIALLNEANQLQGDFQ